MRLRVVVVGIPGVGKTTVVEKARSGMKRAKLVTFGTVMFEEALRLKWVRDRDQMRSLPVERQGKLQKMAATRIARMGDEVVFVDTHLFIRTQEGFWPGLPFDVVRALKPTHLVLVEASPDEILARRQSDTSRHRDALRASDLESELSLARSFLAVSSTLTGAPMLLVSNNKGRADEAADTIVRMLRKAA